MQVILYLNDGGGLSVIHPTRIAIEQFDIDVIAEKVVPVDKPYKIIDALELSTDRILRDAWTIDPSDLTDGVGGDSDTFESD